MPPPQARQKNRCDKWMVPFFGSTLLTLLRTSKNRLILAFVRRAPSRFYLGQALVRSRVRRAGEIMISDDDFFASRASLDP